MVTGERRAQVVMWRHGRLLGSATLLILAAYLCAQRERRVKTLSVGGSNKLLQEAIIEEGELHRMGGLRRRASREGRLSGNAEAAGAVQEPVFGTGQYSLDLARSRLAVARARLRLGRALRERDLEREKVRL